MLFAKKSLKNSLQSGLAVLFIVAGLSPHMAYSGQACTYNEALLALQQGNTIRGQALMKMAASDGDQRAVKFLASFETLAEKQGIEKLPLVSTAQAGH